MIQDFDLWTIGREYPRCICLTINRQTITYDIIQDELLVRKRLPPLDWKVGRVQANLLDNFRDLAARAARGEATPWTRSSLVDISYGSLGIWICVGKQGDRTRYYLNTTWCKDGYLNLEQPLKVFMRRVLEHIRENQ